MLQTFYPQPIMFSFGPVKIYYYGFIITCAIILGFLLTLKLAKKYGIKKDQILDLYFWLIIFGIIGARIYHVLCEWQYYLAHPLEIFMAWRGGLGIFGAIIAGLLVIWIYSKKNLSSIFHHPSSSSHKQRFWTIIDLLSPALILGLAFGRWGNFFNQELFGTPCNFPWCIPIDIAHRPQEFLSSTHFHPTFLYSSLANFLIFATLLILHKIRIKKQFNNRTMEQWNNGTIFLTLITLYSATRFFIEFLRLDSQPEFFTLRLSQWISGGLFIAGLTLLISRLKKAVK